MVLKRKRKIPSKREILKSLLNPKREWNSKTALERFHYFYGIGKIPTDIGGFTVFKEDVNSVHWIMYIFLAVIGFMAILVFYTCYHHLMLGNFAEALPSICLPSVVIAGVPLIYNLINRQRFKLKSLIDFGDYIYLDEHENTEYNRICKNHLDKTMRDFSIKISIMFLSFTFAVIGPLISHFTHGVKTTTTEVRFPFVKDKSDTDFMLNLAIMTYVAVHGGLGYVGLEVYMSMFTNIARVIPDIVRYELNRLADEWQKKSITTLDLNLIFNNIVKQSIDADKFADDVCDVLYWRNFITPVLFTFAIGLSIYCQYTMGFPAGYGIAAMSWVQFYFMCNLGESMKDNGFDEALYDAKWEVFPLNIQRAIAYIIKRKQNQPGFTVGPFNTQIDRDGFSIVTNKIYSLIMYLINFFN